MRKLALTFVVAVFGLAGCTPQSDADSGLADVAEPLVLGPVDGRDLPGTDLNRVQAGDLAPDFTLAALGGPAITLSHYRGEKNVILVFYRGYW